MEKRALGKVLMTTFRELLESLKSTLGISSHYEDKKLYKQLKSYAVVDVFETDTDRYLLNLEYYYPFKTKLIEFEIDLSHLIKWGWMNNLVPNTIKWVPAELCTYTREGDGYFAHQPDTEQFILELTKAQVEQFLNAYLSEEL